MTLNVYAMNNVHRSAMTNNKSLTIRTKGPAPSAHINFNSLDRLADLTSMTVTELSLFTT